MLFLCWKILMIFFVGLLLSSEGKAQTNNTSTVTNSAAPAASSTTTGGTNINYQTNNAYNNENGFGPGIFCRTPTIQMGGNWGRGFLDAYDPIQTSGNANMNYAVNAGVIIPFGSSVLDDCKRLVAAIARDREISSQLSLLRLCSQLKKEGLTVDPKKFPLLAPCAESTTANNAITTTINPSKNSSRNAANSQPTTRPVPKPLNLTPKTNRML